MTGYTVVDVETTGLSPDRGDRVVEIGVVYVSDRGEVQDRWSTLVNPQRDVGPTRIHGISASDVTNAPTFAELAPYILRAVAGRTTVAHNANFDLRFLAAEMVRSGVPLRDLPLSGVCTMQWSTAYLNAPSRRLVDCCRAGGIALTEAHSAAADALATAQLLGHYLKTSDYQPPWVDTLATTRGYGWPTFSGTYPELRMTRRTEVRAVRQDEWLDRIVSRMPRAADARVDSYLATLEMAMLDGFLAEHEKSELVGVATEAGLTRGQVLDLHADYLRAMAEVALEDHIVTAEERADLERVAFMLGLRSTDVEAALRASLDAGQGRHTSGDAIESTGIALEPGDRVVFTGDMVRERDEWEARARQVGLDPGGVTKKTKVVVAADPNSLSGKANKARTYGIPIITEAAFERLLAELRNR
ncbi:DNA polymerase-3 subunit epsilon [Knoellia remsis]|uniref:DNA polymerase-3 subunit epsilon n=1 Tax=Knoellia remsis TaxID=407159 RepID=A0A2T0U2T4_9MICO|nr:exonuclease domain-containing protein [Knoellia remsis]PRY52227.1 DNA polymerase-3 subunit epsilon [Knoellia remsis]